MGLACQAGFDFELDVEIWLVVSLLGCVCVWSVSGIHTYFGSERPMIVDGGMYIVDTNILGFIKMFTPFKWDRRPLREHVGVEGAYSVPT